MECWAKVSNWFWVEHMDGLTLYSFLFLFFAFYQLNNSSNVVMVLAVLRVLLFFYAHSDTLQRHTDIHTYIYIICFVFACGHGQVLSCSFTAFTLRVVYSNSWFISQGENKRNWNNFHVMSKLVDSNKQWTVDGAFQRIGLSLWSQDLPPHCRPPLIGRRNHKNRKHCSIVPEQHQQKGNRNKKWGEKQRDSFLISIGGVGKKRLCVSTKHSQFVTIVAWINWRWGQGCFRIIRSLQTKTKRIHLTKAYKFLRF